MATHSTHITRQQLVNSIVLCGKQIEKVETLQITKPFPKYLHPLSDSWCVIALQKLQQNAVLLDGALEKLDSTGAVDVTVDAVAIATIQATKEFQNLELLEEASTPKIEFEVSNNLKLAIENGRLDMMVFLLELPIQTATGDSLSFLKWLEGLGETFNWVFHCAIKNGQVEMVDWLLLNTSFNPSHHSINALTYAIDYDKVKVVDRLLKDSRVDPRLPIYGYFNMGPGRPGGRYIDAPIIVAVKKNSREGYLEIPLREGTLDIVNRLLQDERVDPSVSNNMPIRFASCYNNLALVDRLLQDERVDPSVNNNEALHSARARELTAIVDRLMMDRRVMLANMVD